MEINGQAVVAVLGQKLYGWNTWFPGANEVRARQMKDAGFLAIGGNWFCSSGGPDEQYWWDRYGFYFGGASTVDPCRGIDAERIPWNTSDWQTKVANIVNYHKGKPWLLKWEVAKEWNSTALSPDAYATAVNLVKNLDPSRITGDIYVPAGTGTPWQRAYELGGMPMFEWSIDSKIGADYAFSHLLNELRLAEQKWAQGRRFIRAVSTTPIGEIFYMSESNPCGDHRTAAYPKEELVRAFLTQVILNARAFEILWGPSQVQLPCTPDHTPYGQQGLEERWQWTMEIMKLMTTTLKPIILGSGAFTQISGAIPALQSPSQATNWAYKGLYTAQKQVSGKTYVGAVNTQSNAISVVIPVSGNIAFDILENRYVPITDGAIRETVPGLTARLYRID